jgi:hypothetical protein
LDAETTVLKDLTTGQDKPIKTAIDDGDVDVAKGKILDPKTKRSYSIDVAFNRGLLVTVDRPITGKPVSRIDSYDNFLKAAKVPRELTLEDAIKLDMINPEKAVIKDPKTGGFVTLKAALADGTLDLTKKAIIDPKASFFVFDPTLVVYKQEPESFEHAVESGHLDLSNGQYTIPDKLDRSYSLKEAITIGLLDPESALIKDGAKEKLIRLPEAFRKGLIDSDKFNVVDTSTSKLLPLKTAVETSLLTTPKRSFDLLEGLKYNLYNPNTGHFSDPFMTTSVVDRKKLTLNDAIQTGLIDPSTTMVREANNTEIAPLHAAILSGLVDPVNGRVVTDKEQNTNIDFIEARDKGYLLPAEQRVSSRRHYNRPLFFFFIYHTHI